MPTFEPMPEREGIPLPWDIESKGVGMGTDTSYVEVNVCDSIIMMLYNNI
jgi:hypothetical protein